ncbi:MAG: glycosyltransferase family 4 protein [Planctomycetes bacterium]|nr:glycosyltransferase family 4 protein [Planctomycetota bacterium]
MPTVNGIEISQNTMTVNVAYLLNSSQIGGANRSMLTLWKGLNGMPVKPLVFCPSPGPMITLIENTGLPYHVYDYFQPSWKQPLRSYLNRRHWIKVFRSNNISLVHANDLFNGRSVVLACSSLGIPLICHVRFPPTEDYCLWAFKNLPKPYGFIFNSKALQAEIGPYLEASCPESMQWVVHNAVDVSALKFETDSKNTTPRVGIIANLQPVKGHEDFIHMASELVRRGHDIVFDIIGGDIHHSGREEQLKSLTRDFGISRNIVFHGNIKDVYTAIQQLDIAVCTSHVEPFGRCIIEAMACGIPVVATRVGGIPEIVVNNENGVLVPPKEPECLADAVEALLNNDEARAKMGIHGRERVEKLFSMETHARDITDVYGKTINHGNET